MEPSAISLAIRSLRLHLSASLPLEERHISIGHPAAAARNDDGQQSRQTLNLFVFRVEHGGYPADAQSVDPIYVRVHCLITAFGSDESDDSTTVSAGENDLRLIGGVVAALHQGPTLPVKSPESNEVVALLEIVPTSFTPEMINNLWSTQQETSYRLSLTYELALLPVPLTERVERSPRVALADVDVHPIPTSGVDEEWAPELRLVVDGALETMRVASYEDLGTEIPVKVAGRKGETVTLTWEAWDALQGWRRLGLDVEQDVTIDGESLEEATARPVPLRGLTPPDEPSQAVLFAYRVATRGGRRIEIRSNPLLISGYKGEDGGEDT